MTAKERLLERVRGLSEAEAAETLRSGTEQTGQEVRLRRHIIGALSAVALTTTGVAGAQPITQPSKTVQLPREPGLECSVSAFGPSFLFDGGGEIDMTYAGGTSCRGGVGLKTLRVWVEVQAPKPFQQFVRITGSYRQVTTFRNPARINVGRQAVLGHAYRVVAQSTIRRNGRVVSGQAIGTASAP